LKSKAFSFSSRRLRQKNKLSKNMIFVSKAGSTGGGIVGEPELIDLGNGLKVKGQMKNSGRSVPMILFTEGKRSIFVSSNSLNSEELQKRISRLVAESLRE